MASLETDYVLTFRVVFYMFMIHVTLLLLSKCVYRASVGLLLNNESETTKFGGRGVTIRSSAPIFSWSDWGKTIKETSISITGLWVWTLRGILLWWLSSICGPVSLYKHRVSRKWALHFISLNLSSYSWHKAVQPVCSVSTQNLTMTHIKDRNV